MDKQILNTIAATANYLAVVDRRLIALVKLAENDQPSQKQILKDLREAASKYRKALVAITETIKKPAFQIASLTDIKTENSTLFAYITAVTLASINGIQKLELQLKKSKTSHGGLFSKKTKTVTVDDDLGIFTERLMHYDQSLSVALHILECEIVTSNPKLHIHDVKTHQQQLIHALSELQTTNLNLSSMTPDKQTKATTSMTNFDGICSNAQELATMTLAKTDSDMVKMHSGFVPMPALIEVLTRNTLQSSVTIESVLELERPENLPYENLSSEETTPYDSLQVTPGATTPGARTPGIMTPGMMTPTGRKAGVKASDLHAELWKVVTDTNGLRA